MYGTRAFPFSVSASKQDGCQGNEKARAREEQRRTTTRGVRGFCFVFKRFCYRSLCLLAALGRVRARCKVAAFLAFTGCHSCAANFLPERVVQ
ncbi:hypothetical protein NDU88_000345 [Pleurodeles waltl]|uniref:Uncharacterized protein n=1 Tax=Pleurodeles waltl TaxID=8319 RepID=A0AAV7V4U5_PLEWA|nr:hypothetical protein NDU88_000345 [Pleurodeles waltl]